jgi:hypothetical protein
MSSACIAIVLDPQEWRVIRIALCFAADGDLSSAFARNKPIEDALEYMSPAWNAE